MGRFRFSLQPALDVAASREREAVAAASHARARVDEARAALNALDERQRELYEQSRLLRSLAMPASQWIATEYFAARLRDVRSRRDRACATAAAANDAARERLDRARNGRLALETLRERRSCEHRAAEALGEAAELDESNAARSQRTEAL